MGTGSSEQKSAKVLEDTWNQVMGYDKDVEMVKAGNENIGKSVEKLIWSAIVLES